MKIQVTARHIERGIPEKCFSCPVAIAVRAATGSLFLEVAVDKSTVQIGKIGEKKVYKLPADVVRKIKHFDETGEMEPFEFELPVEGDI